jgi:hypothetical protein
MNVERLTARTHDGHAYLANVKDDEQEVECRSRNTAQCIMDSWERLAVYEDTDLEPEEITALSELKTSLTEAEQKMLNDYLGLGSLDRLRELTEADRDGRCVVLPCKIGSTVYMATQVFDGSKTKWVIGSRKIDMIGGNALNSVWAVSTQPYELHFVPSEFGRSVFLTREDAEKALEEHK